MRPFHRSLPLAVAALPHLCPFRFAFSEVPAPLSSEETASTMGPPTGSRFSVSHLSASMKPSNSTSTSSLHDMVPITFDLLREQYAKFPSPSINSQLGVARKHIAQLRKELLVSLSPTLTKTIQDILDERLPTGLDSSMYSLRCACEEAAAHLGQISTLRSYAPRVIAISDKFEAFQTKQSAHVSQVINSFLPQDFRATLFKAARQHSERTNSNALRELVAAGGSVRDKYKLMWEQQWKRRETLASVGNASGIWRYIIKYLAGVPEPLLQFAKEINSPKGPTEALRNKFGSALSELTHFAIELNALTATVELSTGPVPNSVNDCLNESLALYEHEVQQFVQLLETVITNSPFFIVPEQAAALRAETS